MKVYVVMCESRGYYNPVAKVSQQGYKTLEEAQAFCRSRYSMFREIEEVSPYIYKDGNDYTYTIVEVDI